MPFDDEKKLEVWLGAPLLNSQTDRETLKDKATQLLRSRSGALDRITCVACYM